MEIEGKRELLEADCVKLKKGMTGRLITSVLFTLILPPVGLIMLICHLFRCKKISKIEKDIRYLRYL